MYLTAFKLLVILILRDVGVLYVMKSVGKGKSVERMYYIFINFFSILIIHYYMSQSIILIHYVI